MNLVKTISTEINKINQRVVKFFRLSREDVQTAVQVAPYGVDSNPVKDMVAVYSDTSEKGKTVIVGYLNKNQLAEKGEFRTFSTNESGAVQFYTWLKNDGTYHIGGDADNMVRYSKLKEAFDQLKTDFNNFVNTYNTHIHTTTATVGATATPGVIAPPASQGVTSSANMAPAKIDKIKTI